MKIKEIKRSATICWSASSVAPDFLATGTVAGAIDDSFASSAQLELFSVNIRDGSNQLQLLGAVEAPERFHRLAWGLKGIDSKQFPYGLLAGGMTDGTIGFWDPAKIINKSDDALVARVERHRGPVRGLEFNPFQPNLLASGATDNEILILDLTNPNTPNVYTPGPKTAGDNEINAVAWNRKVQHIVGSTGSNGSVVVWDLKQKRPVITFSDQNRARFSALGWNPEVATQIIVASDDDRYPSLQIWDLRNAHSPLKTMMAHTKGILSVSWCSFDSNLLLTCGKDNRTLCWNPNSGEVLCELPPGNNWMFDVQWSPVIPCLFSTASFDSTVAVSSLVDPGIRSVSSTIPVSHTPQPPHWLKRRSGVSWGFGGKLVTFGGVKPEGGQQPLKIYACKTEQQLITAAEQLEQAMGSGQLAGYCASKVQHSSSEHEKQTWSFMEILFNGVDSRRSLMHHLGYRQEDLQRELANIPLVDPAELDAINAATIKTITTTTSTTTTSTTTTTLTAPPPPPPPPAAAETPAAEPVESGEAETAQPGENGEASNNNNANANNNNGDVSDFFGGEDEMDFLSAGFSQQSSIAPPQQQQQPQQQQPQQPAAVIPPVSPTAAAGMVPSSNAFAQIGVAHARPEDLDNAIQRAIVLGDFEAAVKCCLKFGRTADALLLAACGGPQLWQMTQEAYFEACSQRPLVKLMSSVVRNHHEALAKEADIRNWKEVLAVLCSYAKDNFSSLTTVLADRLKAAGDKNNAVLCYIAAGNIDQAIALWQDKAAASHNVPAMVALHEMIEKISVMLDACQKDSSSEIVAQKYAEYAAVLANQGYLHLALAFLARANAGKLCLYGAELHYRIFHALGNLNVPPESIPVFPHQVVDVGVAPYRPPPVPGQAEMQAQQQSINEIFGMADTTHAAAPAHSGYHQQNNWVPPAPQSQWNQQAQQPLQQQPIQQQQQHQLHAGYAPGVVPANAVAPSQTAYYSSAPMTPGYTPATPNLAPANDVGTPLNSAASMLPTAAIFPTATGPQQAYHPMGQQQQQQQQPAAPASVPAGYNYMAATQQQQQQHQQPPQSHQQLPPQHPPPQTYHQAPPAAAAAPPPVANAPLPAEHEYILNALHECTNRFASSMQKRMLEDIQKSIDKLREKFQARQVSAEVATQALQMSQALAASDFESALKIQINLTTSAWDDHGVWLKGVKILISQAKKVSGK